jgi:hypothetical protein
MTEENKKGKLEYFCQGAKILLGGIVLGAWAVVMAGSEGGGK